MSPSGSGPDRGRGGSRAPAARSRRSVLLGIVGVSALVLGSIVLGLARIDPASTRPDAAPPAGTSSPSLLGAGDHQGDPVAGGVVQGLALHPGAAVATLVAVVTPSTDAATIRTISIVAVPATPTGIATVPAGTGR